MGHPSRKPLAGIHPSLNPSLPFTLYSVVSCRSTSISKHFPFIPYLSNKLHNASLLTLGYAFLRSNSLAHGHSSSFTRRLQSTTSSWIRCITCTTSTVDLPFLKPAWFSSSSFRCSAHRPTCFAITLPNTRLHILTKHTPLKLFAWSLAPFLCRGTMAPTFTNSSHSFALTSNIFCTISITLPCISSHAFLMYPILTPSSPGADSRVSFMASLISSLSGTTFKHSFASFALLSFLRSTAPLTALSITSGLSSYLSLETLSKWLLNSSTVSCILLAAGLSLNPSRLKHLHVTYSTPGTRFLALLYHPQPPFTLKPFQKPLQLFPRFINLPPYPTHLILQLFHTPTPPSSQSPPRVQQPHSLIPPPYSLCDPFDSFLNLSLPTVHGLATLLFPNPHTSSTVFTSTSATSLQPHSCSPLLSHFCLIFSSYSALFSSFISPSHLTLGTLLSFLPSVLHLLSSTFSLMHTGLWSDNSPNHFCCPPSTHFSSVSPLNITPTFFPWISTTLSSSSPNQTTASSSALSSVSNTISHPSCLTLLSLLLFVSLTLSLLTFQVMTNSNAINPKIPSPVPTPKRSPLLPPLLLLSLLASFLLLLPSPLLLTPLLVGPKWGWIPTNLSATSNPLCLYPTSPQVPNQPQRDSPHAGPRRAPAFVLFRVGSRAATPFPHRSDGGLLERLVLRRDLDSSSISRRFLCRDCSAPHPGVPPPRAPWMRNVAQGTNQINNSSIILLVIFRGHSPRTLVPTGQTPYMNSDDGRVYPSLDPIKSFFPLPPPLPGE